ncbi:MAG: NADH-quinone oxidoreductase subunit C [Gammaproteobacteria bacterium]|nr:NADH-quinone oxidoreductase subunit C [Gammaproteobacteria bacterium]MDE2251030.1 NADH-quinone oxidoreductase subunit C [Gammaproteobacteria bacterium]
MPLRQWLARAHTLPGSPAAVRVAVDAADWLAAAGDVAATGGQLLALWATAHGGRVHAAFLHGGGLLVLELPTAQARYPGLQLLFPAAARMQRAAADLTGVRSDDEDTRPWLRHAAWPAGAHPLRESLTGTAPAALAADAYEFQRVAGDGVHEVPVGPVHAGIIEPGHFRFSIVGEKVLRLEERLGYAHKGIERRFRELGLEEGRRLAARVSGDSAVAYSWAYCQALEGLAQASVPPRALWLRALCLELERMQNHLGDLGALGNDAGFAFGLAQFSRLKEQLLRAVEAALGQRYLLDAVVPGGMAVDTDATQQRTLAQCLRHIGHEALNLRDIYDEHTGVQDRFAGAGRVAPGLARRLGLIGLAGRASGQELDLRCDRPWPPYDVLAPERCVHTGGDVAARVSVRFAELRASIRLATRLLADLPAGAVRTAMPAPAAGLGIGLVEGWRGPVMIALEVDGAGGIARCHPHDPSWQNWPVLEHAILGNIVPDFPLINKSFNLSYSGHDL